SVHERCPASAEWYSTAPSVARAWWLSRRWPVGRPAGPVAPLHWPARHWRQQRLLPLRRRPGLQPCPHGPARHWPGLRLRLSWRQPDWQPSSTVPWRHPPPPAPSVGLRRPSALARWPPPRQRPAARWSSGPHRYFSRRWHAHLPPSAPPRAMWRSAPLLRNAASLPRCPRYSSVPSHDGS